ncbi:MAG TPA: hypothetical protein VKA95_10075 [Nitrososphaeraceae archaeon]|nr:hypothetical protein [Nitrososphaeraceae archaeon]
MDLESNTHPSHLQLVGLPNNQVSVSPQSDDSSGNQMVTDLKP